MVKPMKALALRSVFALLIAAGSLIVLISLYSSAITPAGKWLYCNVYYKIATIFTQASVPDFCVPKENVEVVEVKEGENVKFSRKLLAYIISCWKNAEIKGLYKDHGCYELRLKKSVANVTEYNVTKILLEEDECSSIENADYGCGEEDNIIWKVEGKNTTVLTKDDLAKAINSVTRPAELPVSPDEIPDFHVKNTIDLRSFLSSHELISSICSAHSCTHGKYNATLEEVELNVTGTVYTYDINQVLSFLEREGKIFRPIHNQTIIYIRYNGAKDAVEVIG